MGMGTHKKGGGLLRLIRWLVGIAAVAYLAWRLAADWPAFASLPLDLRWLVLSAGLFALALGAQVSAWQWNLRRLGACVPYGPLFRVYFITNMGRYIPGKVWSLAGMVAGGSRLGVPGETMSTSVVLGLVSSLVSGLSVGSLAAMVTGHGGILSGWFALVPLLSLALLWPQFFRAWMGLALRVLKKPADIPVLTAGLLCRSTFHYALVWCAYAASVGVLAHAFALSSGSFWLFFSAFPLAYLAGYAALFAPGGWGVREGALVMLAGGGAGAIAVSLGARLLLTIFELGLFAFSAWSWRHD
jgi:uncharacterized membrane protein YbhN (UPF0104 family)